MIENKWWPRMDSNHRPLPCQGSALPTELRDQRFGIIFYFPFYLA